MAGTVAVGFYRMLYGVAGPGDRSARMAPRASACRQSVPSVARLLQRHDRTDRRGGDLQRHHGVQGAAQPQRRHHAGVDGDHPGRAVPGDQVPGRHIGAVPSEQETVISQLTRTVFGGRGILYLATIAGTTLILIMAANTVLRRLPAAVGAAMPPDGFLPRQLTYRGSRLVYSRGIMVLADGGIALDHRLPGQRDRAHSRCTPSACSCRSRCRRRA